MPTAWQNVQRRMNGNIRHGKTNDYALRKARKRLERRTDMTLTAIRQSDGTLPAYAWPGGYPIVYMAKDNGILCPKCANGWPERDNAEQLQPVAYFVHY